MIAECERVAYGIGGLKPHEFWAMTPAEFEPYINARVKQEESDIKMQNQRIGLICATLQNGIPVGLSKKGAKLHQPDDYFKTPKQPEGPQRSRTQMIYDTMMAWCSATKGGQ